MIRVNVRQRNSARAREQDEVARRARARGPRRSPPTGHCSSRVCPSTSWMRGRVAWKSKNSSGSICAKRVAPSEAPKKRSAADAASPASFHPVNAQTSAGARSPSGRLSQISGCIKRTVAPSASRSIIMGSWPHPHARRPDDRHAARRRRAAGRPGVHAQGAPGLARRHAVPRARAARPHRRDPRRACSATPTSRPRASSAATSSGSRAASSASATSCSSTCARSPTRPRPRPTRPRSCRSPTATSTSSTASSSTSRARSTTRATPACSRAARPTTRCARSGAARRARAAATTPTSAACSSTRSPSARSRSRPASCTRG